jgi:hypothetical protein
VTDPVVRASVVIPCHDKPGTLPLTVDTVLRQSVGELEVLLLGDGVTDGVRTVIEGLVARDPRVRFLDFPKGPHHGEHYRHDAVLAARSDAIFYLCDDDLFLPDHVADLLGLLERANFVQSLNGFIRPDGSFGTFVADLATATSVRMQVREDLRFNSVSITGTAHSRDFYLAVGEHWQTTPAGEWPDHVQWRRLMRSADFRGATSDRMTALQLPTSANGRDTWTPDERLEELRRWYDVVVGPQAQVVVDALFARGAVADLAHLRPTLAEREHDLRTVRGERATLWGQRTELQDERAALRAERSTLEEQLTGERAERSALQEQVDALTVTLTERGREVGRLRRRLRRVRRARRAAQAEVTDLRGSRSWRLTAPLRGVGQAARTLSGRRPRG